ncbi:MAG: ABC transporter substrate-binding protein [Myxococcota bacterium]
MRRSALLAGLLLALGCASVGAPPPSQDEQAAFDRAVAAGDPAEERAALDAFLLRFPDAVLEPEARLRLGELLLAEGDTEGALLQWYRVVRESPRTTAADSARVRIARVEQQAGRPDEARRLLEAVRFSRVAPEERRAAYRMLGEVETNPEARVRWLVALQRASADEAVSDAERLDVDRQVDEALLGLDDDALTRLSRRLGDDPPAARVWLVRAERALDAGDLREAERAIDRASKLPLAPRHAPRLVAAAERLRIRTAGPSDVSELPGFGDLAGRELPATDGAAGTIGVVLPLSGSFARFGEESLHGVMLAADLFGEASPEAPGVRLLVRDTAGDPARAEAAVRELAADPSVAAIVGPLLSAECEAAASAAEELGVPLITLTSREEIATLRSFVFRLRTRPVEEAQLLVDGARAAGAQRFGILYPSDNYGRALRALFWDAVEARGGEVVAIAAFDPESTDFADPIRKLVGYTLLSSEEKGLIRKREAMLQRARRLPADEARALRRSARSLVTADGSPLPPIVDFDMLFIADSYQNVVLIAPQLAFHEVFGVRLLGPDGWYHRDLVRVGREHVEGAIFVAHYFPESPTPWVRDFADRYDATFLHESNVFAAQAFDAANLVLVQLARGFDSRQAVRDGVLATESYPGASGVLTMRSDGNANKRPFLLGVEKGHVVQLDR